MSNNLKFYRLRLGVGRCSSFFIEAFVGKLAAAGISPDRYFLEVCGSVMRFYDEDALDVGVRTTYELPYPQPVEEDIAWAARMNLHAAIGSNLDAATKIDIIMSHLPIDVMEKIAAYERNQPIHKKGDET